MTVLVRVFALIAKEFATILKDPKSRFVVIGPPIIQFFVFGYAATFDVQHVPYVVADDCRTAESRAFLADLEGSDHFDLQAVLDSTQEVAAWIDDERARIAVAIGPTFSEDLHAGRPASVQVILDGRNSNVASIALGYVNTIAGAYSQAWAAQHPRISAGAPLALETRSWYNPNLQSRWFIVAPLGGEIAMVVVMLLSSLSVAREREQGTFDQLLVSPLTPLEILIGKSAPPLLFGVIDAFVLCIAAHKWFGIPFHGSVPALFAGLAVFVLAIAGVGLFISSLASTMQQALLGSFVFIMPATILGGFTTPIENMPDWLQICTYGNPLRYIVILLREVFLEGARLPDVVNQIWPMACIALLTLSAAGGLFRHRAQ
jgi:ABC-2 type transport system permease protein